MPTTIQVRREGATARLILDPAEGKPPVLEPVALFQMEAAIAELEADTPRLLLVESGSPKFFCLGADLSVLKETTLDSIGPWVMDGHRVLNRLEALPCPVIAKIAGYAMGGGLEIAMACDLIYTTDNAIFGQSEAKLGFIPGWGGTFRLAERIGTTAAKRYFFTGDLIDATAARQLGLSDFTGSAEELEIEIGRIAKAIEANSAYAIASFKKINNAQRRHTLEHYAATEAEVSRGCIRDPDTQNRIEAFFNRKK